MARVLFTGYPGFLGSELLPRLLARDRSAEAVCVVQGKFAALAKQRAAASPFADRIHLVEGDITVPGLATSLVPDDITEIYHLAAIYDLSIPRDLGMRINVEGTRNVLHFAAKSRAFQRLHYVSTCYVSGRHPGVFREDDLDVGQRFNNYYEETKYLAEVEVQQKMREGMPATVYRPSVVVGDSRTGATQKYDGPYYVMRWLLRQGRFAVLPIVGRANRYRFNVVPRDFIVDAISYLSARKDTAGKVYQLADPDPLTVAQTTAAVAKATKRRLIPVPLPKMIAKGAIDYVPGVYRLMRIPSAAVDYFVHPTLYDTRNATAALAGSGIAVPRLSDYLPVLVDFMKAHPEISSAAMA
ncbi:MAG: SDR family oxidoreductase [Thermoanaerobaculia bacterium]